MVANDEPDAERAKDGSVLVTLEGITKSWGEQVVLDGVDLEIHEGTIVGIAGGNGAGKTTLLRIATGMIAPDKGTTRFRGLDIEGDLPSYRQEIGFLSAGDRGLYARLTVRQNLDFWGGLAGLSRRHCHRRIGEVMSGFGIPELANRRVDRLSMGQRQRVRLAMTFLHDPSLVFLDEPDTSLDGVGVSALETVLDHHLRKGGAVLVASPEPNNLLAGRSWTLEAGKLHAVERATMSDKAGTRLDGFAIQAARS